MSGLSIPGACDFKTYICSHHLLVEKLRWEKRNEVPHLVWMQSLSQRKENIPYCWLGEQFPGGWGGGKYGIRHCVLFSSRDSFLSLYSAQQRDKTKFIPSPVGMSYISLLKKKSRCIFHLEWHNKLGLNKTASLRSETGDFGQDGGIGRHTVPPRTTKRGTTTI